MPFRVTRIWRVPVPAGPWHLFRVHHSAEDFATLSEQHLTAADHARSRDKRQMHLEIAHHYARIAALKEHRTNVVELSELGNRI